MKIIKKRVVVFLTAVGMLALLPATVKAEDYYESNNDESTHVRTHYDSNDNESAYTEYCTWKDQDYYSYDEFGQNGHWHYYECEYCYGEKKEYENCTWKLMYTDYSDYNKSKHKVIKTYTCELCGNEKEEATTESHTWKLTGTDYVDWSSSKHEVIKSYECKVCGETKEETSKKKHSYKWKRYGSNFLYECKSCTHAPKYNGDVLTDFNDSDNISIKRGKTYTYNLYNYHKSKNKVKSISYSKKKICKVSRKGKKLILKGLKTGKTKVTVKMKSGAKYTFNVKVK